MTAGIICHGCGAAYQLDDESEAEGWAVGSGAQLYSARLTAEARSAAEAKWPKFFVGRRAAISDFVAGALWSANHETSKIEFPLDVLKRAIEQAERWAVSPGIKFEHGLKTALEAEMRSARSSFSADTGAAHV